MEEWPTHVVTCVTAECANNGIGIEMPDNGYPTFCGVCGQVIVPL